jgi:hypothetical protein
MSLISILGVTLAVLKVIGKIILIILAVILAIILLVLFLLSLPFSYEAGGYVDTANMKKTDVTLKFKYCFGLILNAIAEYKKKKLKILVKVFFFTVMKKCIGGKKKEKEDAEGSTSAESTESTESSESSESEGDVSGEANGSADSEALSESDGADNADGKATGESEGSDSTDEALSESDGADNADGKATGESEGSDSTNDGPKGENFNEGMDLEDEISEEEADLEEEEAELEGKVSEAESREEGAYANEAYANEAYANEANDVEAESPENSERAANEEPGEIVKEKKELGEKLDEIADKLDDLDEVGDKIDAKVAGIEEKYSKFERIKNAIVEIIEDEKFFKDIAFFKKHLLKLLKAFLPKKIEGWLDYGMADPATTGKITAILGMLYGMYAENFDFTPDFETDITYVRGEFKLKGCFCLIYILGQLLRMVFSFHFIRVFKRYKKIMAAVNGEEPKKAKGQ